MRLVHAWWRLRRAFRQRAHAEVVRRTAERLNVGSGGAPLSHWLNIDAQPLPGVDVVLDVRSGLPFKGVRYIFAEHFLEHLTFDEALRFLKDYRNALADDGVLRLSTPNLDWVWQTQYRAGGGVTECFALNKAFRGWEHRFLFDLPTLIATLRAAGFASVTSCAYGER